MTMRSAAMSLLAAIIVAQVAYYMVYLAPKKNTPLTMQTLTDDKKMQALFEEQLDEELHGEQRRDRFKKVIGITVIGGFIITIFLPNRKIHH